MRNVADNVDLAVLQKNGKGFISNARTDGVRLHCAGCSAVGAMVSDAYPKKFFENYMEAKQWLDNTYGAYHWAGCGLCVPEARASF